MKNIPDILETENRYAGHVTLKKNTNWLMEDDRLTAVMVEVHQWAGKKMKYHKDKHTSGTLREEKILPVS